MSQAKDIAMVMPMAGRGSRFSKLGFDLPKPLIPLFGRPFFWWATESLRRATPLREMLFVVLQEHCVKFEIDKKILSYYPEARVVMIPDVTGGAAETAMIGLKELNTEGPVAINDCDHAFVCADISKTVASLADGARGALMCFPSDNPAYSYAALDSTGRFVERTAEKQAISPHAIGGCYFIADRHEFASLYADYAKNCPYQELFMSGVFNLMIDQGGQVGLLHTSLHRSFGTPDELQALNSDRFESMLDWK